jgi:putative hemolysin
VAIAGFFSASETALFSLSRFQLRQLKQKSSERFERVKYLLDRPAALVATVLLGNELTNVFISNLIANYYEGLNFSPTLIMVFNLLTVMPIIMIFGEITPKVIGAKANIGLMPFLIPPLWWFYKLSFPLRFFLENSVMILTKPFRKKGPKAPDQINEDDIRMLLEDGKKKGAIRGKEQEIIQNVFDIDDDSVIEIATPIRDCLVVHQDDSPKSVIEKLNNNFFARIPVRSDKFDQIIGIVYAKDLLNYINRDEQEMKIRDLMKDPLFVEQSMKVEVLFRRFRQMKKHIAIVEDKQGRALAVITMEDILDQLFSELWESSR